MPIRCNSFANLARISLTSRAYRSIVLRSRIAASAATSAARFTGNGGIALLTMASDSAQASTAPNRSAARPAAFENVRATKRCGCFWIHGTTLTPENSAYASSNTTAVLVAACKICSMAPASTNVPVGLLGLAINKTRGLSRIAASTFPRGNSMSAP